jgi:hypothetical protein
VELMVNGKPIDGHIPRAALPDCEKCPKPDLDESSHETILLWNFVKNQQTFNSFSGERLGLRMEAVTAALDELCGQGRILDRDTAFERIWRLDETVNEIERAKTKAEVESKKLAAASRRDAD